MTNNIWLLVIESAALFGGAFGLMLFSEQILGPEEEIE